jgi:hypothetical protein
MKTVMVPYGGQKRTKFVRSVNIQTGSLDATQQFGERVYFFAKACKKR